MTWDIKRLRAADSTAMAALNALFADAFEDADTYTGNAPDAGYVSDTLDREDVIALVAARDADTIGGLVAYVLPKLEQNRREIYIYDLAVKEDMRRRGVARALIAEVQAIAAEIGAWVVYVQADYADPPAVALYTTAGTREEVLHFDIPPKARN